MRSGTECAARRQCRPQCRSPDAASWSCSFPLLTTISNTWQYVFRDSHGFVERCLPPRAQRSLLLLGNRLVGVVHDDHGRIYFVGVGHTTISTWFVVPRTMRQISSRSSSVKPLI